MDELPDLFVRTLVARHRLGRRRQILRRLAGAACQLTAPTMARHAALASGFARFLAGPLVGRALLMGGLAALTGNFALLRAVHRSEPAILFSHTDLLPKSTHMPTPDSRSSQRRMSMRASAFAQWGCNRGATAQVVNSVTLSNKGTYLPIFPQTP